MPAKLELRLQLWREGEHWVAEMETPIWHLARHETADGAIRECCEGVAATIEFAQVEAKLDTLLTEQAKAEFAAVEAEELEAAYENLMGQIGELVRKEDE